MRQYLESLKAKAANTNFRDILASTKNYITTLARVKFYRVSVLSIALGLIILIGLVVIITKTRKTSSAVVAQVQVSGPKATQTLNKAFDFPLTDSTGKEVGKIQYVIVSADKRDDIIVKGQKATAVSGKTFLILNLKIVNQLDSGVQINTKDYVRLSLNGDKNTWLAPDIHNDPVDVQAISTKLTRVGYAINNSDKNLILRVGEINGAKEDVSLNLK